MRLGCTASGTDSTVSGWRWTLVQDSHARLDSSRAGRWTHRSRSAKTGGARVRAGPRSGVAGCRLTALSASGRNGIDFGRQGSDSALWPRRRRWGSPVGRGRKKSWSVADDGCRGRKHDGLRKVRREAAAVRFDRRTRERGRPGERTAVRPGEVERETDDVDRRTAIGRRKHGVRSMPAQRDFPLSAVAIA